LANGCDPLRKAIRLEFAKVVVAGDALDGFQQLVAAFGHGLDSLQRDGGEQRLDTGVS
jgi:hypothetical protein